MENFDNQVAETDMKTLRGGIKRKYEAYHALDRDRFPEIEYNTNRANYEPLRESFEEEFYGVRGMDRVKSSIHIPSTNTLALIFCDDNYVPGKKILNTCRSYAEGKSKFAVNENSQITIPAEATVPVGTSGKRWAGLILLILFLTGVTIFITTNANVFRTQSSAADLVMQHPVQGKIVPREILASGKVNNASTVWLVIRAVGGVRYWVQPPIMVEEDGTWRGPIYIGSDDKGDIGVTSQIRAFVNPVDKLKEGDILHAWPEAELSTKAIEVTRGALNE